MLDFTQIRRVPCSLALIAEGAGSLTRQSQNAPVEARRLDLFHMAMQVRGEDASTLQASEASPGPQLEFNTAIEC